MWRLGAVVVVGACGFSARIEAVGDAPGSDADALCAWSAMRKLSFANDTRPENLDEFPALLVLEPGVNIEPTSNDGRDLRFRDADDAVLAYEIEHWDPAGRSYVWVRVPRIDASSADDHIFMYYGNADATDAQRPAMVWSAGYVGVWHFAETAPPFGDSARGHEGASTAPNLPTAAIGKIAGALDFDGIDDRLAVTPSAALEVVDMTLEAWVNIRSANQTWATVLEHARNTADWYGLWRSQTAASRYHFRWSGGAVPRSDFASQFQPSTWHHIAGTLQGQTATMYLDGAFDAMVANATQPAPATGPLTIGMTTTNIEPFPGLLDEVRISNVARSAAWLDAQHASMTNVLVSFSAPEPPCM